MNANGIRPVKDIPACADCRWAVTADMREWWCHAPEVAPLLESGNTCAPCRAAREFNAVCGAPARFFRRREGWVNGCLAQDAPANSGHSAEAHVRQ